MSTKRTHYVRRKAFTLLELILVMVILCTVLAIASPSLRGFFSSMQINDISEQIVSMARYAKVQAIYNSNTYRVNFDVTDRLYWISKLTEGQFERLENGFGNYYRLPEELTIKFEDVDREEGIYYLEFDARGYTYPCEIRIEDKKENVREIVCRTPAENFEVFRVYKGDRYEIED